MDDSLSIHPLAVVESPNVGEGTRVWAWAHVMPGARIGKRCNIGEHCYLENDVIVGDECTIKNLSTLWDGITLEDHVFIGPGVVSTNDKYPRSKQNWELSRTVIHRWVTIGAGAVILCGISIGPFAMIAAGAVVTKSVPAFNLIAGNPGCVQGYVCACARPLKINQNNKIMCENCGRFYKFDEELKWSGGPALP